MSGPSDTSRGAEDAPPTPHRTVWEGIRKRARSRGTAAGAFDIEGEVPTMRLVMDPLTSLDEVTTQYVDILRADDPNITVLRRFDDAQQLRSEGDYTVIEPRELNTENGWGGVTEMREGRAWNRAIPYAENNIQAAYNWAAHYGLDPDDARARELDAQAAISLDADLYMTDNAFALHGMRMRSACTVADAFAVIGLHQRLRSRVLVGTTHARFISTWMAEHIQAIDMLPSVSAQFADDNDAPRPSDETLALLRAMLIRVKRALASRDRLLVSSLHPDGIVGFEGPDELVGRTVVSLQGLFDAAGRALNSELPKPFPVGGVSFARDHFRTALPDPVRALLEHQENLTLRELISTLRNTIHNEPFGRAAFEESGEVEALATLEGEPATKFRAFAEQRGQTGRWTLFEDAPARPGRELEVVLRPVPLIDDLIALSCQLANTLIAAAPWATRSLQPSTSPEDWSTYPPYADSVRRGYGLGG